MHKRLVLPGLLRQACLLTTFLMLFQPTARAVALPTPEIQVSGVALPFVSVTIISRTASPLYDNLDFNGDGVIDTLDDAALSSTLVEKVQPTFQVTGVDLSPLPVSLPNQIREISLALPNNEPWRLNLLAGWQDAYLSNLVLNVRTSTIWGDIATVDAFGDRSVIAVPIMSATGTSSGQDLRANEGEFITGVYTPTWPSNAPFARPEQLGPGYHTLGSGLYQFPGMDNDSLLIVLNGLRLTDQAQSFMRRVATRDIGDMLIAVRVQAIPEPGTWALMSVGLLAVAGLARQRQASTRLSR